jgi:hypothetical protein
LAGKAKTQSVTAGYDKGQAVPRDDRSNPNVSIASLRGAQRAATMMRSLFESDASVSTAVTQFVSMASTDLAFHVFETGTNEVSEEGQKAIETVVSGFSTLWNYTAGFQDRLSLQQLKETLLLETILTGGCAGELILDTHRIPQKLNVIPYDSLSWKSDGRGGKYPYQTGSSGEIDLNLPNIFVAEAFKSADRLHALPVMVAGLKRLIAYESFTEDLARVVRQAGAPRLLVKLDHDRVRASASPSIQADPEKLAAYMSQVRVEMQDILSGLEPQDALVFFDLAEVSSIETTGEKRDYAALLDQLSGLAASALKSNPSSLGLRMSAGSQNTSSTESLLSTKLATMFQKPVETVLSRAFTLALRLYGLDCYVQVRFNDIDLRPKAELSAHKTMQQAMVLELLSLGRITDVEAQSLLGLPSLPEDAPRLAGTGFYESRQLDTLPASGTNAVNNTIKTDQPTSGGGRDNEERV